MAVALLALAVFGIPAAILLLNGYGSKRGCGGGCGACPNYPICHGKKKRK